jgi:hypothetical protein
VTISLNFTRQRLRLVDLTPASPPATIKTAHFLAIFTELSQLPGDAYGAFIHAAPCFIASNQKKENDNETST